MSRGHLLPGPRTGVPYILISTQSQLTNWLDSHPGTGETRRRDGVEMGGIKLTFNRMLFKSIIALVNHKLDLLNIIIYKNYH